jgi:hypothetical protein
MYRFDNISAFCIAKIIDLLKSTDLNLKKLTWPLLFPKKIIAQKIIQLFLPTSGDEDVSLLLGYCSYSCFFAQKGKENKKVKKGAAGVTRRTWARKICLKVGSLTN